jgi:arylsulfatase/arylsulfatase A
MNTLKQLNVINNTIVIYMSDNGPNTKRYVGEMRGKKGNVVEGGIRTMFYMHWPDVFKGGESSDVRVAHYDVMPTLLDAANITPPENVKMDGRSFLPLLTGKSTDRPDRQIFIQWHRGYKPMPYKHFATTGEKWSFLSSDSAEFELYDLTDDPFQTNDLSDDFPGMVDSLKTVYFNWFNDVSSTRKDNYEIPRIIIGNDAEPESVLTRQDWIRESGKGWGDKGYWLLTVDHDAVFDIKVRIAEPRPDWNVTLNVGATERKGVLKDSVITFRKINLKKGDITLSARVEKGKNIYNRMHVFVKRVSD